MYVSLTLLQTHPSYSHSSSITPVIGKDAAPVIPAHSSAQAVLVLELVTNTLEKGTPDQLQGLA